jgi:hypothetical protein
VSVTLLRRLHSTHATFLDRSPRLFSYISVILLITGSYLFWGGTGLSDAACRHLSYIPSIFKCAAILATNANLWLNDLNIRSASYGRTVDHGLEVYPPRSMKLKTTLTFVRLDRTYNISGQRRPVLYFLTCLYFAVILVLFFLFSDPAFPTSP